MASFELHSNNCRLCMKHTRLSEHHFLVNYKNNITELETPNLDLPTEKFTIHENSQIFTIICAKTQNISKMIRV